MIQAMLILLAVTLPVFAVLRAILGKRVQALMLRMSKEVQAQQPASVEEPEVKSTSVPRVARFVSGAIPPAASEARLAATQPAQSLFLRLCLYDALGVTGVLALRYLALEDPTLIWVGAGWLILMCLRYVLYVGQYKHGAVAGTVAPGWFRRWILVAPEALLRLFTHPRYAWWPVLLLTYTLYAAGKNVPGTEFWAALLVLVPLLLRVHLRRVARKGRNRRLLILRVFGRDENATLTFGAIRNFWKHIGSTFTVVDPSYVRYKYRGHSETHVAVVFFSCYGWAVAFGTPEFNEWWGIAIQLSVLLLLAFAMGIVVAYRRSPRLFAASSEQIHERLRGFLPRARRWDLNYRDLDMYCFDNTWRSAVEEFVRSSDVVLMDLRGYSAKNKGCETEVNFLFDSIPVGRIVFLISGGNDSRDIEELIQSAWRYLKPDSPNRNRATAEVTVFDIKDGRREDVKGLLDVLVAASTEVDG